jgi:hypothetical protein
MPEIGGKRLAGDLTSMLTDLRTQIDSAKQGVAAAVKEIKEELSVLGTVETVLRSEAAAIRASTGEVLGNNPPQE